MTSRNVPRLRFKGFGDEWGNSILSNLASIFDGVHKTPNYVQHGIPFYSVENLKTMKTNKYISNEEYENNFNKNIPEYGDVLMSRIGSIGEVNLVNSNKSLAFYVTLALIKPNNKELTSLFLNSAMQSPSIQKELWRRTLHVAFPKKINKNEIGNVAVNYPSLPEQQHIGDFFSKLDHLIDLHSQKLEQLKKLKRGYLQKMFPQKGETIPRLRFRGLSGEWKEVKVGEIFKVGRGQVLAKNKISDIKTSVYKYPVYSSQTRNNGLLGYYDEYLYDSDITWTTDGANAGTVMYRDGKFYSTNVNGVLHSDKGYGNVAIANIINSVAFRYVSHVGNPKLMNNVMSQIRIRIPEINEQKRISNFLITIDNNIKKNLEMIEALKHQKKAYLQKMFI